jgi:hypothetical protein
MVSGLESCALQRLTFADALSRNFQDLTPSFDALSRKLSRPDTIFRRIPAQLSRPDTSAVSATITT